MNILLFTVGSSTILHQQANYALRSLYTHIDTDDKLYILTESPALYQSLPFVETIILTEDDIQCWRGKQNYFFRVKINAIKNFVRYHADDHLVFLDADTYCIQNLDIIKHTLSKGYGVMHRDEGSMTTMKGDSATMWQTTKGRTFSNITITEQHHMWNSGVVGIPRENLSAVIDKALALCDEFLDNGVRCFNLEQWSFAIALMEYTLEIRSAQDIIGHYWHHKYVWCRYIARFFADSYAHGRSLQEELEVIRLTDHQKLARRLSILRAIRKVLCLNY